jgi:hypothetical protein
LLQLTDAQAEQIRAALQAHLHSNESELAHLLTEFLSTTDQNFHERYRFFYEQLADSLQLYRVGIGDTVVVKALTRQGYLRSCLLEIYGTYSFRGLEKSPQAGAIHMVDLDAFRELYGFTRASSDQEIADIQRAAGTHFVPRERAEAELFATRQNDFETKAAAPRIDEALMALRGTRARLRRAGESDYAPSQLDSGPVLNVAVRVANPHDLSATLASIEREGRADGLALRAVPWQQATGFIGQFTSVMRTALLSAVLIIFAVALVIINNALVMATLKRVGEIGTLRALGAQRPFILCMLVAESIALGAASGGIGSLLGISLVSVLGRFGIPAANDFMTFFCAGPRLFPSYTRDEVAFTLTTALIVSVLSSVCPAWIALRVSPREAMQTS